ncbi:phosphotransferase [Nocardia wallacei]|uniref:phosphotransferase n=1 Tax=Nocardia wallacei TaxID=480035 RepID=UPI0024588532|nr:phosphotransferase [Nocardia wallacei]
MPLDGDWLAALTRTAREAGAEGEPEVLSDRADGPVVRVGEVVAKAHAADTDEAALRSRLRVARDPRLRDVLLPPLPIDGRLLRHHHGRPITVWQYGIPVDPDDPDAAPWEQAAALLARLHATAPSRVTTTMTGLPAAGAPDRVRRAVSRLRAATHTHPAAAAAVLRASDQLPELENSPKALVHGDFHLGQLVVAPGSGENPWRLIDVDDLGMGDPAWDLARPAAFFATGILEPVAWERFLMAYRRRRGAAIPPGVDEWTVLDIPARALVIQHAALAVVKAGPALDDLDTALIDACLRMP